MRRLVPLVLAISVAIPVTPAFAWGNGVDGPDTFGTHDWILREGVRLAGGQGRWVCLGTALKATDDPDTKDGIDHASDPWWHAWDEWGTPYGGAPEAVRVWFHRIQRRLRAGDRCGASRTLGLMSHMLGDVAQPMHTDDALAVEDLVHLAYERDVDTRCTATRCRYTATDDGGRSMKPYRRTLVLARASHPYYALLVDTYERQGYSTKVDVITRRQLRRAANALADLIRGLR